MEAIEVDLSPILGVLGATLDVSGELALGDLEVGAEEFVARGPATFDLTLTNTGAAVISMGQVSFPVSATCARCLADFPTDIEAEVDGFYVHPGHEGGLPEEQEFEFISGSNTIDVAPSIAAALVLEAPFAPVHDEECAGICPECGADLNEGPCGCTTSAAEDHPFAGLKELLGEESSEKSGGESRGESGGE